MQEIKKSASEETREIKAPLLSDSLTIIMSAHFPIHFPIRFLLHPLLPLLPLGLPVLQLDAIESE